ncbi:MAG: hypothetical protein JO345_08455 [Streptosporangiaceae bacterium]|nr:hypothetical protein [Streptosporangiaceae bacterium]
MKVPVPRSSSIVAALTLAALAFPAAAAQATQAGPAARDGLASQVAEAHPAVVAGGALASAARANVRSSAEADAASETGASSAETGATSQTGAASETGAMAGADTETGATDENLSVDLGTSTGAVGHGADGALYGIYDQGVPSENLISGMGLQTTDTKAQDGQQHPGSDALEIARPFVNAGGRDIYIYMTDVYRNFPYERTSYAQYQGYMKTEVEQVLTSPYKNRIILVPYNEPDGNWFGGLASNTTTRAAFLSEWLDTYKFLKQLWPQARIAGPNFYQYQPAALSDFLTFCKANQCLPDVITWHELANTSTVAPDVAAFRQLESPIGLNLPISLDEYAARYQLTSPGRMVAWLSAIENAKVGGDLPYWNQNGSLGDTVSQNNIPNGQWWLYHWYSSLTGHTVSVAPPSGNTDNTLQAVAALDTAKRQARIILGGGPAANANVLIRNIDPKTFGTSVHASIYQDDWSGMTGAAAAPSRIYDGNVTVSPGGTVSLPVTVNGPAGNIANCTATGARVAGKIGNAVKLCGNNEYVQLPNGIVSGLHDFTVSAWVNPSVNSGWSRVFDFGTGTSNYMFLTLSAGGGPIRFAITTSGGGGEQQINGTSTLPLNTWSLVTVTLSGTTGTLYVNGQAIATNSNMTLNPAALGNTTQDYIGKSQYNDPYLTGEIDDFNIYSSALTASQVAALAAGQPGAGDVADYKFDETSGATATDSSSHGSNATIISNPSRPTSMDAYQIILSPGGAGSAVPTNGTWSQSYPAANATMTGSGWNINTEGTPANLGGFATYDDTDVGGLRTGSSTVMTFNVSVPQTGDYTMRVFDGSYAHASDVSGPTNIFARVDGGAPTEIWLPDGYEWVIWNYGTATLHLTAGAHTISLSTVGANGDATNGDAIINKIDLTLKPPAAVVYPAAEADLSGAARVTYPAGTVDVSRGGQVTFWVYSASDGYSDLAFGHRSEGAAVLSVNGLPLRGPLSAVGRVYLSAGVNKIVMSGLGGVVGLDALTVTPSSGAVRTYQAADGVLAGTAKVVTGYSQASGGANGGVVTGVGGGPANSLTLTVNAPTAGPYAMTVRYANNQGIIANHYNPDLMTAPADISVNGGPTFHVNFANTFDWNQFWKLTIPVRLHAGANTIRFIANPQYNWDSTTIGVIYSGSDVGDPLRSQTAPNLDQITLAPFQA